MKLDYTWESIELKRDKIHRRSPELAVRTRNQALRFINKVGFCFLFKSSDSELPSLWNAMCGMRDALPPKRSQRGPYLSFMSDLKSIAPDGKKVYYGKVLQGRPTVISLEFLPYFFALYHRLGRKDEYLNEYLRGRLSPLSKEIMEALIDSSPQDTKGLRLFVGSNSRIKNPSFEKAIGELQSKLLIVNVAKDYDPFTFEWEPVHKSFGQQLAKVRTISAEEARVKILGKYIETEAVSSVQAIHHLFGWKKQIIFKTLGTLIQRGSIVASVKVDGNDGTFYAHIG